MMEATTIDRFARALFYAGASIMLGFIAWVNIAPLAGTDPSWWSSGMATAALLGLFLLSVSFLTVLGAVYWGIERNQSMDNLDWKDHR